MKYLYEWIPSHIAPRRWMAFSFYSARINSRLYVAFPLNLIVTLAWWIQDKWARTTNAPSWIDREVAARTEHHKRSNSLMNAQGQTRPDDA